MSLGVLNNISALYAENNLNQTQSNLQNTLTQLSSGSVLNSGADNPAGLSLANGMAANSAALAQSSTNASEGVGLLQVADGALSQVTNLLDSAVTLATEASNGTLNSSQDAAANQEYQSILAEVNNIGSTTTYNSQQVFTGSQAGVQIFTGDSSAAGSSVDDLYFASLSSATVGDQGGTVQQSSSGTFVDLSKDTAGALTTAAAGSDTVAGGLTFTTTNADGTTSTLTTTATTVQALVQEINKDGIPGVSANITTAGAAGVNSGTVNAGDVGIMIDNSNSNVSIAEGGTALADSTSGGTTNLLASTKGITTIQYVAGTDEQSANLAGTDLSSAADAKASLLDLNSAVSDVAAQRGYIGSQINTLNAVSGVESTQQENLISAENSITATDYGQASTDLSQEEILTQTASALWRKPTPPSRTSSSFSSSRQASLIPSVLDPLSAAGFDPAAHFTFFSA
jgi:flagellin